MNRGQLREMFGGRCAYCGNPLKKKFHADHVEPIFRGWEDRDKPLRAGKDVVENLFPSCPRCNNRKATLSVDQFREEIKLQPERLRRYVSAFRLAEDFGMILETKNQIVFWFEKYQEVAKREAELKEADK